MHLKDKLKNKNKEYTTIDIYQIKKNIDILNKFNVYGPTKYEILPSYIDLEHVLCSEYYDKFIENIKRKNIGKYQEYISDEKEYQELSDIKQIKISYSEIFNMYSGMEKISNFKNKMFDRVPEELINFKDSFKKEAENTKKSFLNKDFNESLFQKRIQEIIKYANINIDSLLKFLNEYKNDLTRNINAYNKYFTKYLTELDKTSTDISVDSINTKLDKNIW